MKGHSHHCRCGLKRHLEKLRAGRLGLLGCSLIILHLLWHVAECLVLPAIFVAITHHDAEAAEVEAIDIELDSVTPTPSLEEFDHLRLDFQTSLSAYYPYRP